MRPTACARALAPRQFGLAWHRSFRTRALRLKDYKPKGYILSTRVSRVLFVPIADESCSSFSRGYLGCTPLFEL